MSRYSSYAASDSRMLDEFDAGFFGFNNRFRPDQLKQGVLASSNNGRMNLNGEWQVRKGIDAVSNVLITTGTGITLSFTLNDASPPVIDDDAQPRIWASAAYSNPNDTTGQYLIVALNNKGVATDLRTGTSVDVNYPPGYDLGNFSFLLQAFNNVILFREANTALVWDGQFDAVSAGSFVTGKTYRIDAVSTGGGTATDFTAIGATDNSVGTVFTASGAGAGTGTAFSGFTRVPSGTYSQPVKIGDVGNNTVIANGVVTVTATAHGLVVDEDINVTKSASGLTVGDSFKVATVPSDDSCTFFAEVADTAAYNAEYTKPVSRGTGLIHMPAPAFGTYHNGRLAVPYAYEPTSTPDVFTNRDTKDEVLLSNGLNINTYDVLRVDAFKVNAGTADFIVGLHSFSDDTLLVFNRNSIHAISGTTVLSSAQTSLITNEVGCVAKNSIVQVGNTILFLSDNGIYGVSFQDLYNLRGNDVPLSESIDATIQNINRNLWHRSSAVYFDNKYFIAVPLNSVDSSGNVTVASTNNCILIFNFINKQWESVDTVDNVLFDYENLIVAGDGDARGVYAVNSFGGIHRLDQRVDGIDRLAANPAAASLITTHEIPASCTTRQYTVGETDRKKWNTFEIQVESSPERASDFNITAETENIDYNLNLGSLSSANGGTQLDAGDDVSIRGRIGNSIAYGIQLTINNTSGRPRIKSIKTTGALAFSSTNRAI